MSIDTIKCMDIEEFRTVGLLQEVNRKFFHPLGLALEVIYDKDGSCKLGRIWDYRGDPEGNFFGKGIIDVEKIKYVDDLRTSKREARFLAAKEMSIFLNKRGEQLPI